MEHGSFDVRRIEAAAVAAWPAVETAAIDGWLWRHSGGGSHRANSVATLAFRGSSLGGSIARAEALFRARGGAPQFQLSSVSEPTGLDEALAARGYAKVAPVITMARRIGRTAPIPDGVDWAAGPDDDWLAAYGGVLDAARLSVASAILARVPADRAFVSFRQAGVTVSTCLGVAHHGYVCIQCVATRADRRRQGGAGQVIAGVEAWAGVMRAHTIFLQVAADNAAAIPLYERAGFTPIGQIHYRLKG
jgi:ribosomal protein S18 acetylase RimI-like enzyme